MIAAATDPHQTAAAAIIDLMVIGEILERLGLTGGSAEDGENVTATHVEWLGRCVSETAGRANAALVQLRDIAALREQDPPPRGRLRALRTGEG